MAGDATMQSHDESDNDGAILWPDVDLPDVGGEAVRVRRFRYLESLRAAQAAPALVPALAALAEDAEPLSVMGVIGQHADEWAALVALSCDRSADWVAGLDEADGHRLGMTFWRVNRDFFALRLMMAGISPAPASHPSDSSASSSKPDTARST